MTRRASSVYQFFQYKEELRTAKISLLVLVIAVLCWGPFFLNLALLASIFRETNKSSSSTNEDAEEGLEGHLVEIKGHTVSQKSSKKVQFLRKLLLHQCRLSVKSTFFGKIKNFTRTVDFKLCEIVDPIIYIIVV